MSLRFRFGVVLALVGMLIVPIGCDDQEKGTAIGAAGGAIVGGLIGDRSGNATQGMLIGAGAGALAGNAIGATRDKKKLRDENEQLRRELERREYEDELQRLRDENERLRQEMDN